MADIFSAGLRPLPRMGCIDLKYKERSYQLRVDQLTTRNIAKLFNLVPDTIVLISVDGVVSLPDDNGSFDVDDGT